MFGFVVADADALTEEEKERYRAMYCGLCFALRDRYGQLSRACLTYDLTFFALLCASLHEPIEECGESHCLMHPAPAAPRTWVRTPWTDYAADLAVALAYHKCLDDVADDGTLAARAGERLLAGAYERAQKRIPEQCAEIERAMDAIRAIEQAAAVCATGDTGVMRDTDPDLGTTETAEGGDFGSEALTCAESADPSPFSPEAAPGIFDPDGAAREFGIMLGRLFGAGQGFWAEGMETFGAALGRFVYLMDAAVDFAEDAASGSYNPFVQLGSTPEAMRTVLALAAADAAEIYERLPLVQDKHLMDAVLYSGVWAQFNRTYSAAR